MQQLNKQILQKSGPAAHCENIRQIRDAVKFVVEVKQTNGFFPTRFPKLVRGREKTGVAMTQNGEWVAGLLM